MAKGAIRWALLLSAILLVLVIPLPHPRTEPEERTFHIRASQFSFDPGTVVVNPGDRVTLEVEAVDMVHGIYVDGYDLSVTADPGQTARLTFVADRAGSFRFRCSVACGDLHPFMIGRLRVGPNQLLIRAVAAMAVVIAWGLVFAASLFRTPRREGA
ncbi:MAG: cupredoxin domain-containing protein [Anaerolineae bacterium]|nr:cupredoxin domain-containing protein [Anaerolineae bacterium]